MDSQLAIVGIGNVLRGDDGLGCFIAETIEPLNIKNVKTFIVHQLQVELLEELQKFGAVIFVDASFNCNDFLFEEINTNAPVATSSSHHINAAMFVQLSQKLYPSHTHFYSCAVKGYVFDMAEKISPQAKANANKAIEKILSFMQTQFISPIAG
jgi:hydrogenase maturation protease